MRHRQHRPEAVAELQVGVAAIGRIGIQVHVHVDQAGQQAHAVEVDAAHVGGDGERIGAMPDRFDVAIAHHDLRVFQPFAGTHVEQARGGDQHAFLVGGAGIGERGGRGRGDCEA